MNTPNLDQPINSLEVKVEPLTPDQSLITVVGEINCFTLPGFEEKVSKIPDPMKAKLVVDLDGLNYIDSMGLKGVMLLIRKYQKAGGLEFCRIPERIMHIFRITGLARMMKVVPYPRTEPQAS